jgi:hypothetical protein
LEFSRAVLTGRAAVRREPAIKAANRVRREFSIVMGIMLT